MYREVGAWSEADPPPGSVVVGYNGRDHSREALMWGAQEAVQQGAPLLVVFAANYPGMNVDPGPGLFERDPGALDAAYDVTGRGVAEVMAAYPGLWVAGATEVTSAAQAMTAASKEATLVVLGSRGYGRVAGALLNSVGFAVAARAACPVIVVKDGTAARPAGPEHRVVVGTDGSAPAGAAVRFAADRAAAAVATLEILTCTGGHLVDNVDERELRASAAQIAESAADQLRGSHPGLHVTTRVEDCPAELALLGAASDAGLVVVGTRGRGAFEGMFLGSVSHAVIHGADCAVAIVDEGQA
ncbi:universal stress protein [Nocardioides sp.]|uniref:universal stress protein n=1 Tax=Nocardioides sp. TaxID=35761 RepID=UPI002ED61064